MIVPLLLATSCLSAYAASPSAAARSSYDECSFVVQSSTDSSYTGFANATTLSAARTFVAATLASTGGHLDADLVICLSGRFDVSAAGEDGPHALDERHSVQSGGGHVIWRGLDGATISGGAQVTGWAAVTLGGGAAYVANVPSSVGVGVVVRQLWVAESRTSRTISTNPASIFGSISMWTGGATAGYLVDTVPSAWLSNSTTSIEFTWPIVLHNWVSPRCTIASIAAIPPSPGGITGPFAGLSLVSNSGVLPGGNISGQIQYGGSFSNAQGCEEACNATSVCTGYTWHDNTVTPDTYQLECFFRIDGVYAPASGWPGHYSGDKGGSAGGFNISLASPCGGFLIQQGQMAPVTVEAAPTFPLSPGTFYHDADGGLLYYALASNQSVADLEGNAWVAASEVLLDVNNSNGQAFEGIAYTYGAWSQVNTGDGYVDQQAAVYACTPGGSNPFCNSAVSARPGTFAGSLAVDAPPMGSAEPRGNVRVSSSTAVSFSGCSFVHLAAAYALSIMEGSRDPVVYNCTFNDLSGGFLHLGGLTGAAFSSNPADWDAGAQITENVAFDMAVEYDGACGYFGGFLYAANISHNSVSDAGYSGFSHGWGWGTVFPEGVGLSTISYNRIENVMRLLRDGGGIYVNGAENSSFPSDMSFNYVDGVVNEFAVYYLDNGASHWNVHDNVCTAAPNSWAYFMTGGANLPALNNQMSYLWYSADSVLPPENNCAQFNCTVNQATIFPIPAGMPWPAQAQDIINGAGAGVVSR